MQFGEISILPSTKGGLRSLLWTAKMSCEGATPGGLLSLWTIQPCGSVEGGAEAVCFKQL